MLPLLPLPPVCLLSCLDGIRTDAAVENALRFLGQFVDGPKEKVEISEEEGGRGKRRSRESDIAVSGYYNVGCSILSR